MMSNHINAQNAQQIKQLQQQTKETKTFLQDVFKIDYINTSKIFYQKTSNSSDVKVNNYLCYQQGQNLCKITQIIYQDKIIRIQDKFEVTLDPTHLDSNLSLVSQKFDKVDKNCSRTIQKVRIFNKKVNKDSKTQKRDKKNIVKNIVKIFLTWLQTKQNIKNQSQWTLALSQLKNLIQSQNFNNRLIHKIIVNTSVSHAFLSFLQDSAQDQIKYSRIQDKQSHFQALQIYKNLLKKPPSEVNTSPTLLLPSKSQDLTPVFSCKTKLEKSHKLYHNNQDSLQNKDSSIEEPPVIINNSSIDQFNPKNKSMDSQPDLI